MAQVWSHIAVKPGPSLNMYMHLPHALLHDLYTILVSHSHMSCPNVVPLQSLHPFPEQVLRVVRPRVSLFYNSRNALCKPSTGNKIKMASTGILTNDTREVAYPSCMSNIIQVCAKENRLRLKVIISGKSGFSCESHNFGGIRVFAVKNRNFGEIRVFAVKLVTRIVIQLYDT